MALGWHRSVTTGALARLATNKRPCGARGAELDRYRCGARNHAISLDHHPHDRVRRGHGAHAMVHRNRHPAPHPSLGGATGAFRDDQTNVARSGAGGIDARGPRGRTRCAARDCRTAMARYLARSLPPCRVLRTIHRDTTRMTRHDTPHPKINFHQDKSARMGSCAAHHGEACGVAAVARRTTAQSALDGGHGRGDGAISNTAHYGALGTMTNIGSGIGAGTDAGGALGGGRHRAARVTCDYWGHRPHGVKQWQARNRCRRYARCRRHYGAHRT